MKNILTILTLILTGSIILHAQEKLEVDGAIIVKDSEAITPEEGTIQWDGTDFVAWNGVRWVSLTNYSTIGTVTDIDGTIYQTVRIGNQVWMAENLRTKTYNNNTIIPEVTDAIAWAGLTTGARCAYNNNPNEQFLYNWFAVSTENLCPTGWHVPTESEWDILTEYLGGVDIAGGKMKEIGTTNWASPNNGATNESGFNGVPNGYRLESGGFSFFPNYLIYMWSATENGNDAFNYALSYLFTTLAKNQFSKNFGFSVRCIED